MTDETTAPEGKRRGADADNEALLARYGFSDLPVVFALRNGDGSVMQEKLPSYQCMADGFYGRGREGTHYQEGDIIVFSTDMVPNEHLQPLNRAAALRHIAWRESLPASKAPIDIGDMAEAAQMLAKDPRVTDLPPDDYQAAVTGLAAKIKLKRLGKDAMELPSLSHNFAPVSGGKSPPILGAKLSDLAARNPGFTNSPPGGAAAGIRRAQSAPAPLGGSQR